MKQCALSPKHLSMGELFSRSMPGCPESFEPGTRCKETLWFTELDHASLVHHNYAVEIDDRTQTMGDKHDGVILELALDDDLDGLFGLLVHTMALLVSLARSCIVCSTCLLVASSRSTILPSFFLSTARARKKSCFCPWLNVS